MQKSHIIIGGSSITGRGLEAIIRDNSPQDVISSTSRSATQIIINGQTTRDIGLDVSSKNIDAGLRDWITGQTESLFCDTITLHLHAMRMGGVDTNYPEKVVAAFKQYTNTSISNIFISYEKDAHVDYGARSDKDALEESVKRAGGTIVDLIVFDSPSAKILGPTFVGVVGDFLNNTANLSEAEESRRILKEILGVSFDEVLHFLARYPLRGDLQEGQKSMKELADQGKFQAIVNEWAKKIGFGDLSLVSGIISELYINLAMWQVHNNSQEVQDIGKEDGRVLLDWKKVLQKPDIQKDFRTLESQLKDILERKKQVSETDTRLYTEKDGIYTVNPHKVSIFNEHFGILPLILQHALVSESGLIGNDEYISSIKCGVSIFAGDKLKLIKKEEKGKEKIYIINAHNPREEFTEIEVQKKSQMKEGFKKPDALLVENDVINGENTSTNLSPLIPHRDKWMGQFLNGVPTDFDGVTIPATSAILENIGFRIGTMIKLFPERLSSATGGKATLQDFESLKGMFGKISIDYMADDIVQILKSGNFEYYLQDISVRGKEDKMLSCKVVLASQGRTIGNFSIIGG